MQRIEEAGTGRFEHRKKFFFPLGEWFSLRSGPQQERQLICEV